MQALAGSIVLVAIMAGSPALGAPAAQLLCTRTGVAISGNYEVKNEQKIRCARLQSDKLNFNVASSDKPENGQWSSQIPHNAVGVTYLSVKEMAMDASQIVRAPKQSSTRYAYFTQVFAENFIDQKKAKVDRNATVEQNLDAIRGAVMANTMEFDREISQRQNGIKDVSAQLQTQFNQIASASTEVASKAVALPGGMTQDLAIVPNTTAPIAFNDLVLSNRQEIPGLNAHVGKSVETQPLIGHTQFFGAPPATFNSATASNVSLKNAIDAEQRRYNEIDLTKVTNPVILEEGRQAIRLAARFLRYSPKTARMIAIYAVNARQYSTGLVSTLHVPAWDQAAGDYTFQAPDTKGTRLLTVLFVIDQGIGKVFTVLAEHTEPVVQRAPDNILGTTQDIVQQVEEDLHSDPVASLDGLFRARTLVQNVKRYGSLLTKLTSWTVGTAKKIRNIFSPDKAPSLPKLISKELKSAFTTIVKAIEAGEYAAIGVNKLPELFGSTEIADLRDALNKGATAAMLEGKSITGVDRLAPTFELWTSAKARRANEKNTRDELKELLHLRTMYLDRIKTLQDYSARTTALGQLAGTLSSIVTRDDLGILASTITYTTMTMEQLQIVGTQLQEVQGLANTATNNIQAAQARYREQVVVLDDLIDAWDAVLPTSPLMRLTEGQKFLDSDGNLQLK